MLQACFETLLKMSLMASFIILLAIPVKIFLQKILLPGKTVMLLWLIIAIRLICPYAPKSNVSIFNMFEKETEQIEIHVDKDVVATETPDSKIYKMYANSYETKNKRKTAMESASLLWIAGIVVFQTYGILQNYKLRKRMKFSTKLRDNIYESDKIKSSFVSGFFFPKIYVPAGCENKDIENMIIHEKTHIALWHNKIKTAAWIILTIHWFNPIVWIAFYLFSNDLEYVCDESSVAQTGKKSYITSIIKIGSSFSDEVTPPEICSFSSLSKRRVKRLAKYKKHNWLCSLPAIVICICSALCFGTNCVKTDAKPLKRANPLVQVSKSTVKKAALTDAKDAVLSSVDNSPEVSTVNQNKNTDIKSLSNTAKKQEYTETSYPIQKQHKSESNDKLSETVQSTITATGDATTNESNASKYKSDEKSDIPYGGFQHLEPENITSESLTNELEQNSMTPARDNTDLSQSYIKGEYVSSEEGVTIENVKCDNNGNISLYISLNTDSLFDVTVYDRDTKENVYQCNVLANGENAYSFLGFDENKSYDITLKEPTKGQWKTEGSYVIY